MWRPLIVHGGKRVLGALGAIAGALLLVFVLRHLVPGNPVDALLGERAAEADRAALSRCLDLDRGVDGQLLAFARDLGSGTLGISCRDQRTTVAQLVAAAYPRTLELALAALMIALVVALPLGIAAALRPGGAMDASLGVLSLTGIALPVMALGPLLLGFFYVRLGWLPGPADAPDTPGALVLPAATLGAHLVAMLSRMTRASLLNVLGEDFIRTAHARGVPATRVVIRHALPSALPPVVTVAGLQLGALLAGAIVTEKVFGRPGLGTLLLDALAVRDWKVVQGVVLVVAVSTVVVNLLVDLAQAALDPRVRVT